MENLSFEQMPNEIVQMRGQMNRIEGYLMKLVIPPASPEKMDFDGLLVYINERGYRYSKSKLQKQTANKEIPFVKFNGKLIFDRKEIDKWVSSNCENFGQSDAALTLAESANRKLNKK